MMFLDRPRLTIFPRLLWLFGLALAACSDGSGSSVAPDAPGIDIDAPAAPACNADFTHSPNPRSGMPVAFTPVTSGASYQWTFAGGTPSSSTSPTPTSTFAATGSHDVSLTVSKAGCTTATTMQTLVVACPAGMVTFQYTGAPQSFAVPDCVTTITIDTFGASGGAGELAGPGGKGGRATGTLTVGPGTMLSVWVGGAGTQAPTTGNAAGFVGGFNGGGSVFEYLTWGGQSEGLSGTGGGASDVRVGGVELAHRVIVAGGGGGGGDFPGADGGGLVGGNAIDGTSGNHKGGFGGTQAAGGATNNCCVNYPNTPGAIGVGGNAYRDGAGSGGGGGGYYGGGGGQFAGAGGGSSFVGTLANASTIAGVNEGNGRVVVTW